MRYLPGELARAMIARDIVEIHNQNGKGKSIKFDRDGQQPREHDRPAR